MALWRTNKQINEQRNKEGTKSHTITNNKLVIIISAKCSLRTNNSTRPPWPASLRQQLLLTHTEDKKKRHWNLNSYAYNVCIYICIYFLPTTVTYVGRSRKVLWEEEVIEALEAIEALHPGFEKGFRRRSGPRAHEGHMPPGYLLVHTHNMTTMTGFAGLGGLGVGWGEKIDCPCGRKYGDWLATA